MTTIKIPDQDGTMINVQLRPRDDEIEDRSAVYPKCKQNGIETIIPKPAKSWLIKNPKTTVITLIRYYGCPKCLHKFRTGERQK